MTSSKSKQRASAYSRALRLIREVSCVQFVGLPCEMFDDRSARNERARHKNARDKEAHAKGAWMQP